ncbi:hypothetical protein [Flexibacterium corallicola]|uniref:hypothetical protein n=1 Tax=Flexibacterium corallicola TaxID=3037259 RepID=UPI00286F91B5|nr:hypothetical protein [Pseudovibrio sp. M1P-2-3]
MFRPAAAPERPFNNNRPKTLPASGDDACVPLRPKCLRRCAVAVDMVSAACPEARAASAALERDSWPLLVRAAP